MKIITAVFLFFATIPLAGQEKKAILFSRGAFQTTTDKTIIRNDVSLVISALTIQGFKKENIFIDSVSADKTSFLSALSNVLQNTRKADFLLLYFYQPVAVTQPENETSLVLNAVDRQYISLAELATSLRSAGNKINNQNAFFCIFNSDLSAINTENAKNVFTKDAGLINSLYSSRPGEGSMVDSESSLFTNAFSVAITSGSSFITTYEDLLNRVQNNIILHTSRQRPVLYPSGTQPALFNGRFTKSPVYFTVKSQPGNETIVINAGENLNILPGTVISFYRNNPIDNTKKIVTSGNVTASDELTATVKLSKPFTASEILWASAGWNENENPAIKPLKFNINYSHNNNAEKKKYFEAILKGIRDDPQLQQYIRFVSAGGDLQISDIGLKSKDSISCTFANPRTGRPLKDFYYSTNSKEIIYNRPEPSRYSEVEEYIINSAQWQYLSKLHNSIPELHADVSFMDVSNKEIQTENGFPVVYENDELKFSLHNAHTKKIFFAVIALRTDKSVKLLYPGQGEESSLYQIEPGKTVILPVIKMPAIFGLEKIKIVTSTEPIEITELWRKNILTRKKESSSSFRPEYTNIQDFDYEIRSRVYAAESSGKKIWPQTTTTNKNILIRNPSLERIFFNVLQFSKDGKITTLLPDKKYLAADCGIDPSLSAVFNFENGIEKNVQLITIYADRPFLLTEYQSDTKAINELLVDIIRTGRVPGSPLNKITLTQQVFTEKSAAVSRGGAIIINLITPKIVFDKGSVLQALTEEYSINGFAFTEDSMSVKMVKINGEEVKYNRMLMYFDKILSLGPGNNKIVIEAIDDKGFTEARILEVELKRETTNATAKGTNYFLGIAIDKYQVWHPLNNARNDVDSFSKILQSKFGYLPANTKMLIDTAATRRNIIKEMRNFLKLVKSNDIIIIYFSGHGNRDKLLDGDYYFVPCEGQPDDISSYVKSTDIIDNFKGINAKHCLLIMDACYSGLITNSVNKQQISIGNAYMKPVDLSSKWIITSARASKAYDGEPGTNSPFASVMLSYLRDNTDESRLTVSKLIEYLKDNVSKQNTDQTPFGISIAGEGELVFKIAR